MPTEVDSMSASSTQDGTETTRDQIWKTMMYEIDIGEEFSLSDLEYDGHRSTVYRILSETFHQQYGIVKPASHDSWMRVK